MKKRVITLRKFIEENSKLISVVGIFGGLTAYFSGINYADNLLSFATFLMFILLCWELWVSFPKSEEASGIIRIFEVFFIFFVFLVGGYMFTTFKKLLITFSVFPFMGLYTLIITKLFDKFKLYKHVRKIAMKNDKLDPLVRAIFSLSVIILVIVLAVLSANLLSRMFGIV